MATLIYTTGNGYSCSCCRRSSQEYTHFDIEDIDSLIKECIDIARCSDWDFYINTIDGYGAADDLETKIMQAIKDAESSHNHQTRIKELVRQISSIDDWFNTLDAVKANKAAEREKLSAALNELGGVL